MKKLLKRSIVAVLAVCTILSMSLSGASAQLVYDSIEDVSYPYYNTADHSCQYSWYKYYEQMASVPLTGDGARDAVAVALSQIGYQEGNSGDHTGVNGTTGNYTEYAAYMGHTNGAAWCATFCSWVYYVSGARSPYYSSAYWNGTYVPTWSSTMSDYGRYHYNHNGTSYVGTYTPKTGDTVYFVHDYSSSWKFYEDHIGIVVYFDGEYVWTIEGNTTGGFGGTVVAEGGGVFFKRYHYQSSAICGYGEQPFATVSDLPELDYSGANPTPGLYMAAQADTALYSDTNYTSYGGMVVPFGTMFEVLDIEYDSNGAPLLYSKVKIGEYYYYGYVLHGSATNGANRTLQIYASENSLDMTTDYEIGTDSKIDAVSTNTTVADVLSNFTVSDTERGTVAIFDKDGNKVTDTDASVGTGMTVKLLEGDEELKSYEFVVKGDVDGDGKTSTLDYTLIRRHIMGTYTLDGSYKTAGAIVNGKSIHAFDYLLVKRAFLGTYTIK